MEEKNYLVSGMHCAGCAAKVERAVEGLEGVERVELNLLTGKMTVLFEKPDSPAMERIAPVVEKAGFRLADWKEEPLAGTEREERLEQEETGGSRLVWSILLLVPLMYLSMGPMWHWPVPEGSWGLWMNWWTQGILAGAVLWLNRHYLINGVRQLVALSPNMDSLIAIGSGSAFLYGLYLLVAGMWQGFSVEGMELYFESAAMIVTLISLGKYLERRSYRKTNAAVKGLVKLVPQEALVWHDGAERAVPLDEIRSGELVVVKTGQRIPVDGMIEEGQAALDESDLTGESMPVDRAAGDRVISGTFNRAGYLKIRAERVGGDSTLARMIRLVEQASQSKAPIARLADRVCYFFVPAVIAVALVSLVGWMAAGEGFSFALARAIAVLVISCPCVLGLATPIAIMVGTGRGARLGILCKSAGALEALSRVDTVVFDKTGTLTEGEPRVVAVLPEEGMDADALVEMAAALEQGSEHPVGKAVYEHARLLNLPVRAVADLSVVPGRGIAGTVDGVPYAVGNSGFMQDKGISWKEDESRLREFMRQGASPLYVGRGGCPAGVIMVADSLKPDSRAAVDSLKRMNLRVVMLTGDNAATARHMAGELHIDEVVSDVLPDEKASHVMKIEERGDKVAMVGDGVNDAPSIKRADIGVGMGITGTDVTKNVADMVLADDNFATIIGACEEGRRIYDNIRKVIQFLLSANLAEVFSVFIATLIGFTIFQPVQLLWVNLVTDCFPALALGMEDAEGNIMKRKPRNAKDGVFAGHMGLDCVVQGLIITVLVLASFFVGVYFDMGYIHIADMIAGNADEEGVMMAFITLNMVEIFHCFNMRSRRASLFTMKKQNKWLWASAALALVLTVIVTVQPTLAEMFFGPVTLELKGVLAALGLAFLIIPLMEIYKAIMRAVEKE